MKRNYVYNVRITDELKERLWKMTEETGIQHTGLVGDFIKNLCNFYEENGEIRSPFMIFPKKDFERLQARLAELEDKTQSSNTSILTKTARKRSGLKPTSTR